MIVYTPKKNKAIVKYTMDGIPMDENGFMPLYIGYTIKNKIIIQPHLENDKALLQHELTHVDQYNDYFCFHFRYNVSKEFRFKMEAEAFAAQLKKTEKDNRLKKLNTYSNELSTKYNINKSFEECRNLIMKFYGGKNDQNN